MIHETQHKKLNIQQHYPHKIGLWIMVLWKGKKLLLHWCIEVPWLIYVNSKHFFVVGVIVKHFQITFFFFINTSL
jgi:hypothetical protein